MVLDSFILTYAYTGPLMHRPVGVLGHHSAGFTGPAAVAYGVDITYHPMHETAHYHVSPVSEDSRLVAGGRP